jgi:hypothetical protein
MVLLATVRSPMRQDLQAIRRASLRRNLKLNMWWILDRLLLDDVLKQQEQRRNTGILHSVQDDDGKLIADGDVKLIADDDVKLNTRYVYF